ncbi:hypothetical protein SP41_121 [Salmonella phage 41]|nr:hypothetical protein SP41_121 [Salmonella phage 41]
MAKDQRCGAAKNAWNLVKWIHGKWLTIPFLTTQTRYGSIVELSW